MSKSVLVTAITLYMNRQQIPVPEMQIDDPAEVQQTLFRVRGVDGPAALHDMWWERQITDRALAGVIATTWSGAEYPDQSLDAPLWRQMFHAAGYTRNGKPAERPAQPVTLWRGSVPDRRRDWSWTCDRAVAERFAFGGVRGRPLGTVWEVTAPPKSLMSYSDDGDESEYVVDTHGLRIRAAAPQVAGDFCWACGWDERNPGKVRGAHLVCICERL